MPLCGRNLEGQSPTKNNQSSAFGDWLVLLVFCLIVLTLAVLALVQGLQYHRAIKQIECNRDITSWSGSYTLDVVQSFRRSRHGHYLFTLNSGDRLWFFAYQMEHPEEIAAADAAGEPLSLTFQYGDLLIENDLVPYRPFSIVDTQNGQVFLSLEDAADDFHRSKVAAFFLFGLFLLCGLGLGSFLVTAIILRIRKNRRACKKVAKHAARKAARAKKLGTSD